jgi:hypothetical protein
MCSGQFHTQLATEIYLHHIVICFMLHVERGGALQTETTKPYVLDPNLWPKKR